MEKRSQVYRIVVYMDVKCIIEKALRLQSAPIRFAKCVNEGHILKVIRMLQM